MRQRPARFNILPDKSGVPAGMMRLDFSQYHGAPAMFHPPPGTNNSKTLEGPEK